MIGHEQERRRNQKSHVHRRVVKKRLRSPADPFLRDPEQHHRQPREHQNQNGLPEEPGHVTSRLEAMEQSSLAETEVSEPICTRHRASSTECANVIPTAIEINVASRLCASTFVIAR